MSLRKKGLFISLEDSSEVSTVSLEAVALEAEEEMAEMREEHDEIADDINSVEEAGEDSETLERIKDTMEESVEEGEGISEDAAEIAEVAIEAIYNRLGLSASKVMPAMESFGSTSSRTTATKIALEGIKETVIKIWEGIKQFFKNIWNKIVMFYSKLGMRREKIEAYIKEVKKSLSDVKASAVKKKDELENKGLAKKFSKDGDANYDTAKEIEEVTFKIFGFVDNIGNGIAGAIEPIVSKILSDDSDNSEDDSDLSEEELKKVYDEVSNKITTNLSFTNIEEKDDKTVVSIKPLPGNVELSIVISETSGGFDISTELKNSKKDPAEKIKALDQDQINSILTIALEHIKKAKDYEKQFKTIEKVNKASDKIANEVIKQLKKFDESEDKTFTEKLNNVKKTLQTVNLFVSKFSSVAPIQSYTAIKGLGDYAKVSIANLEEKSK